jgi:hypothetical protein
MIDYTIFETALPCDANRLIPANASPWKLRQRSGGSVTVFGWLARCPVCNGAGGLGSGSQPGSTNRGNRPLYRSQEAESWLSTCQTS